MNEKNNRETLEKQIIEPFSCNNSVRYNLKVVDASQG